MIKERLTGTELKILALILMILDHLAYFFNENFPSSFRILGRLSAPIFLFLLVEGYYYTKNKNRHILKMYAWAIFTLIGNGLLKRNFSFEGSSIYLSNNIFLTFALTMTLINSIDNIRYRPTNLLGSLINAFSVAILILMSSLVEGGIVFISIGLIFYFFRDRPSLKFSLYIIISLSLAFLSLKESNWNIRSLLINYQWFMVFAVFPILMYNGKRGHGLFKNFFYMFYPIHIWFFYLIKYYMN